MATVHNNANKEDISEIVIMSGDPLRVKSIAFKYLNNVKKVNDIRNMDAYTGFYKNKKITIMAHGMGMPSMGIYAYELFKFYDVKKIIRLGSCGSYSSDAHLLDIILVNNSYTESNFSYTLNNEKISLASACQDLNNKIWEVSKEKKIKVIKGNVSCSDCFDWYMDDVNTYINRLPKELNIIANEMESFALFYLADKFKKEAACLLTVVDSHYDKKELSAIERQKSIDEMTILALESIIK